MKEDARRHYEAEERHQGELIQAVNSSKDSIVQAILTLKS